MSDPITSASAEAMGTFSEYRKIATTRISDFTVPPGVPYQTPEGLRAEDEPTRIAFDVQGCVYPIRESVFGASYAALSTTTAPDLTLCFQPGCAEQGHVSRVHEPEPLDDLLDSITAETMLPPKPTQYRRGWADAHARIAAMIRVARESPAMTEPSLDAAWAAVEAALPEGWRIEGVMLVDTSDDEDLNVELVEWEAEASSDRGQRSVTALGSTPAAALLALAEKLRESQP